MSILTEFLDENFSGKSKNKSYYLRSKYRTIKRQYCEIYNSSKKLAAFLAQNGVTKGDKIVIKSPNSPQWVAAFISCL
ncbi:MAG: AMP-binding protein, partial [Candidatus Humimicrobiaceae bacterium]